MSIEKILKKDSLAESEKLFGGKHWSEFTEGENMCSLLKCVKDNEEKTEYLQNINDTYSGMGWDEFKILIKENGFVSALEYDFVYNYPSESCTEEAIIYYNSSKGLIIWATSFGNKKRVNGGNLYGEIQAYNKEAESIIWKWLSTGGCINGEKLIYKTSQDVREGLFGTIGQLEEGGKFLPEWTELNRFLWFVDYNESKIKGYDNEKITKEKISRCPQELKKIIGQ